MAQIHHLSPIAHERLKAELDDLTHRGRIEIAQKIEEARALGDLSENGDYHAAKEEQGKMEGRIAHLAALLRDAVIVETPPDTTTVHAGSVVTISYTDDDAEERYLIGSIEERHDDLEVISPGSPLGQALIGADEGQTVTYALPTGIEVSVTVLAVEN